MMVSIFNLLAIAMRDSLIKYFKTSIFSHVWVCTAEVQWGQCLKR